MTGDENHIPSLAELFHDFGEEWQIQFNEEVHGCYTAVRRPTPTAFQIVVAHDIPGLRKKLESAG